MSSPLATARILAAREAPLAGAGGRCPLETILIESFLLLSSDCVCREEQKIIVIASTVNEVQKHDHIRNVFYLIRL